MNISGYFYLFKRFYLINSIVEIIAKLHFTQVYHCGVWAHSIGRFET